MLFRSARDKPLEVLAGSTLRHGESLADRIEYTIWQRRTLRGAGTCSSQACPVHFNGEVLYARRSRVEIPGPAVAAAPAEAPAASPSSPADAAKAAVAAVRNAFGIGQIKRTLRSGDGGTDVRRLQDALRARGQKVNTDGRYGRSTVTAVRDFQRKSRQIGRAHV